MPVVDTEPIGAGLKLIGFALIESRVQATVEGASFAFLGGIGRFVPNPRLGDLTDRLETLRDEFIDNFRSLNFAGDQQLEQTLERFRRDLLSRSAEEYRNQPGAMSDLTEGLNRLRENAVQLARSDARHPQPLRPDGRSPTRSGRLIRKPLPGVLLRRDARSLVEEHSMGGMG